MQDEIASTNEIRLIKPTRFDSFKDFFVDVISTSRANSANGDFRENENLPRPAFRARTNIYNPNEH